MNLGGGSPFYHCRLCTKAYSSEKSLNKHMRKKHGLSRDQQQLNRSQNLNFGNKNQDLPTRSPSKASVSQQHKRHQSEEDMVIVCPECNGTIRSKKGVAKHYMCFHNVVYSAWKTGWFGRNVRLMDLTPAMIGEYYANGGNQRESLETSQPAAQEAALATEDDEDKETDEAVEPDAVQLVENGGDKVEENDWALVSDGLDVKMSAPAQAVKPTDAAASAGEAKRRPAASIRISRRRRSKLKTSLATTSPFFFDKNGKLEFNSNEDPLDINCPFCIVHKTTIKGLAKHCVNHHPTQYEDWKEGGFGSVQLRYIRPNTLKLNNALNAFKSSLEKSEMQRHKPLVKSRVEEQQQLKKLELKPKGRTDQILPGSISGLNLIKLVPCPVCHKMVRGHTLAAHYATQHPEELKTDNNTSLSSIEATAASLSSPRRIKPDQISSALEDEKQATPCPFCGELIFSKGMGKHCIYFHNDQYQEWKAGKYGSVPLRFVPSQVSSDVIDVSGSGAETFSKHEAGKNNGMSIVFPGQEVDFDCSDLSRPTMPARDSSITLRLKPSLILSDVHPSKSLNQSSLKNDSGQGRITAEAVDREDSNQSSFDEDGALLMDCDDDQESADEGEICDEEAAFTCHYCDATFESSDDLKKHFKQKHVEEGSKAAFDDYQKQLDKKRDRPAGGRCQSTGRFICDICHTPYPSKRSLSQHYRIHKFDRLASCGIATLPAACSGTSAGSTCTVPQTLDTELENREPGEVPSSSRNHSNSLDRALLPSESPEGDRQLRLSNDVDVVDTAALPIKKSEEATADCPKCSRTFRDKLFLLDHMHRCFAEPLSRGKLDAKDLTALAGVDDVNDTRSSSPPTEKSHRDFESQKVLNENQEEVYKCQYCDRTFKTSSHTRNHEQFCSSDSMSRVSYACEVCGKRFYMKCHLAVHMKVHRISLDDKEELSGVASVENAEKRVQLSNFECKECGKVFSSTANLLKHKVVHTNSSVTCKACNREFKMACHLARHFCSAVQPGSPQPGCVEQATNNEMISDGNYECDLCHRTFQYADNLTVHKRFCQQHGSDSSAVPVAILLDADDEGFECSMCNETFRDKLALDIHTQACRLTDWKPAAAVTAASIVDVSAVGRSQFQCRRCPVKFYSRSELLEHLSAHGYSNSGDSATGKRSLPTRPPAAKKARLDLAPPSSANNSCPLRFQCDLCSSQFSSSLGLVVHKSKCHPDVYGPSQRRAQQQQQQQEKERQQMQIKSRLIAKILMMPDQQKNHLTATGQSQPKISTKVQPSAASQLVITKSSTSYKQPCQPPVGPPLLSLPNRCQHCPRAFLTLTKLNEHLTNVHGEVFKADDVKDEKLRLDDSVSVGGLVLDYGDVDNDDNIDGNLKVDCGEENSGSPNQQSPYHEADAYLCAECDRTYSSLELLTRHVKSAHLTDAAAQVGKRMLQPLPAPSGAKKRKSVPMATPAAMNKN